jgi:hypothetical protein
MWLEQIFCSYLRHSFVIGIVADWLMLEPCSPTSRAVSAALVRNSLR